MKEEGELERGMGARLSSLLRVTHKMEQERGGGALYRKGSTFIRFASFNPNDTA
jgi:hypothetical protein